MLSYIVGKDMIEVLNGESSKGYRYKIHRLKYPRPQKIFRNEVVLELPLYSRLHV